MLIQEASFIDHLINRHPSVAALRPLLEADSYDLAAEQLTRLLAEHRLGDTGEQHLVILLRTLCLALHQCRQEKEWYRWAMDAVIERQKALQSSLRSALVAQELRRQPSATVLSLPRFSLGARSQRPAAPIQPPAAVLPVLRSGRRLLAYTLGTFEVYVDDQRIDDFPNRKCAALFRYLLVHRRPVHREQLIELLWEGSDPELARNRLNNTLYGVREVLRRAPTDAVFAHVVYENEHYRLNAELDIWTDYEHFRAHCQEGRALAQSGDKRRMVSAFQQAEMLYQGAFMPDSPYEDWIEVERTALQNDYLFALETLSEHFLGAGDYAACMSACQKLLAVDACNEEAHRRLMRCYARQGQTYLAQRQYQTCVRALKRALDVSPASETTALYEQMQAGHNI